MPVGIVSEIAEVRSAVAQVRKIGSTVGLVPTMGALHAGHASLIRTARAQTDFVAVSIYVNPSQFGPHEDFSRYPRTLESDQELCRSLGVDLIYTPETREIYPAGYASWVEVDKLSQHLCGASRPGHFRGVATIVLKLMNIVQPDVAFFGQKDIQQAVIIRKVLGDLHVPTRIEILPTVRESDGLAMSSRNRYLDPIQRRNALVVHRSLQQAYELFQAGERNAAVLMALVEREVLSTASARLDYACVVDLEDLQPVALVARPAVLAEAVYFGSTRLIDNIILTP